MKLHAPVLFLCLQLAFFGCDGNPQNTQKPVLKTAGTKPQPKTAYVIIREGAEIWEKPDPKSETHGILHFGEKLEVIRDSAEWLIINVPNSVGFNPVYIQKYDTGSELDIPLTEEDLNEVYSPIESNSEAPEPYSNIEINLISKAEFSRMKKTAAEHFTADTQLVRKKNGGFDLKIGGKPKRFQDGRGSDAYEYIGQFKGMNKYLLLTVWYEAEDASYILIDKTTGKETAGFSGFPYYSKDRKMVMSMEDNLYRDLTQMAVYTVAGDSVKFYAEGEFKNWMPADSPDRFWGSDNCFYLPVLPSVVYYQSGDESRKNLPPDYNYRYVKIKIKGPTVVEPAVIPFYPENAFSQSEKLTPALPYPEQIRRIDSLKTVIQAHYSTYTKSQLLKHTDTYAFKKGSQLQLVESQFKQEDSDNIVKWYYLNGELIAMDQVVNSPGAATPIIDDKYYIYKGKMFALYKSGKRVMPTWKDYEAVSLNIPETGKRYAQEAKK